MNQVFSVRLDPRTRGQLEALAAMTGRTRGGMVRWLIKLAARKIDIVETTKIEIAQEIDEDSHPDNTSTLSTTNLEVP